MTIAPEKTGPANAETNEYTGARSYIHPVTDERFVSVTTFLQCVAKENLPYWAAKMVQEHAMDHVPLLVQSLRKRPCEVKGEDRCRACRDCVALELRRAPDRMRDEAADRGSRIHHVAEQHVLTGEVIGHNDDIAEQVRQYIRFRTQFQPTFEASEMTVISRTHGFAGTLDAILRLQWCPPKYQHLLDVPVVADIKSGKNCYPDQAMQLAAYKHADAVLLPDGTETPLPDTAEIGLLLHVRPENYWVRPVDIGDATFKAFLSVLDLWRWQQDTNPIQRAMYKPGEPADDPEPASGTTDLGLPRTTPPGAALTDADIPF